MGRATASHDAQLKAKQETAAKEIEHAKVVASHKEERKEGECAEGEEGKTN
jgi:hypothetical protein